MFWRFGAFCGGKDPVNLLLPRNLDKKWGEEEGKTMMRTQECLYTGQASKKEIRVQKFLQMSERTVIEKRVWNTPSEIVEA